MAAGNCDLPTPPNRRRGLDRVVIMVGAYHSISLFIKDTKFQDHIIVAFNSRLCRCRHLPLWNIECWHSSRRRAQCSRTWLCARMVQLHLIRHVLLFSGARDVQLVFQTLKSLPGCFMAVSNNVLVDWHHSTYEAFHFLSPSTTLNWC